MFYLKKFILTTESGEKAYIDLKPGLNIIYGPSNTGKSLIVDCIDFMYGGAPEKLIDNPIRFKNISLILDVNGETLFLSRDIDGKMIDVSGNVAGIENGQYTASKGKRSIHQFWLNLMGIEEEIHVLMTLEKAPQLLGIRTFIHTFLIKESRMSSNNSILKSGEGFSRNIPTPTIMSLIFLLTGITYTDGTKVKSGKIREAENEAIRRFVDRSLSSIGEQKLAEMNIPEDEISPDELQQKIDEVKNAISDAEENILQYTQKSHELADDIVRIDQQITEAKVLRNRYKLLMSQYESDIKRLTFIAEGDLHKEEYPKLNHCPFCNGELPKEKEESCIEAAISEVSKLELQIKDLLSAEEQLEEEIEELSVEKNQKAEERLGVQKQIRSELEPKLSELNNNLNGFRVALGRQKVSDIFDKVANTISTEMEEVLEDEKVEPFDIKGKIKDIILEPLNDLIPYILKNAGYDDFVKAGFDVDSCDIKINGVSKEVQGQGYCSYLNAILAIAVQEMLNQGRYKTNLLVLDSPILSLAEKRKPGDKVVSNEMKKGLFKYMDEKTEGYQSIIIENYIPDIEYKNANLIEFTKDDDHGRYGLVESYRLN